MIWVSGKVRASIWYWAILPACLFCGSAPPGPTLTFCSSVSYCGHPAFTQAWHLFCSDRCEVKAPVRARAPASRDPFHVTDAIRADEDAHVKKSKSPKLLHITPILHLRICEVILKVFKHLTDGTVSLVTVKSWQNFAFKFAGVQI